MLDIKSCDEKTDAELVVLTLKNQDFYYCLVKRYENKLLRYILRISSFSQEDAEDILQDIFIKTYININDFNTDLKFSSWIYRIAHNEVISHYRKAKARPQTVDSETNEELLKIIKSDNDIIRDIDNKILKKTLYKAIGKIDKKYKEVLILKFLEEKDYQEISDILKKPSGTVGTLISRAKKKLREELLKQTADKINRHKISDKNNFA